MNEAFKLQWVGALQVLLDHAALCSTDLQSPAQNAMEESKPGVGFELDLQLVRPTSCRPAPVRVTRVPLARAYFMRRDREQLVL